MICIARPFLNGNAGKNKTGKKRHNRRMSIVRLSQGAEAPKTGAYKLTDEEGNVLDVLNLRKGDILPKMQKNAAKWYEINL